jgi:hypothetical protein
MDDSVQYQQGFENGLILAMKIFVMKLMKGNTTLYFDRTLKIKCDFVLGIKLIPMFGIIASTSVESNKIKN